jgi:hypothetical protein
MPVSSYPRVTVQGTGNAQNTQNGQALMVFNSSTGKYEAATAATFGGAGGATAANQTTQIANENTLNGLVSTKANQTTQINQIIALATSLATATNGGLLQDIFGNISVNNTFQQLPNIPCKYVTIINSQFNFTNVILKKNLAAEILLETGYSIRINLTNTNQIEIKSSNENAFSVNYIVTA